MSAFNARDPLPKEARAKLVRLVGEAADAQAVAGNASNRIGALRKQISFADGHPPDLDQINAEIARLTKVLKAADDRHRVLAGLCADVEHWLHDGNHVALEMAASDRAPKPAAGKTYLDEVYGIRAEIDATRNEIAATLHVPVPNAYLKTLAKEYVEELVATGKPIVRFDGGRLIVKFGDAKSWGVPQDASVPYLAWMHPNVFLERMEQVIDRMGERPNALMPEVKEQRLSEARAKLEGLERREEMFIEAAAADGIEVLRRASVDPYALLNVTVAQPKLTPRIRIKPEKRSKVA